MPPKRAQKKRKRKPQRGKGSFFKCDKFYKENGYIPERCQWWTPEMGLGGWERYNKDGTLKEQYQTGTGAHYYMLPFIVK